MRYAVGLSTDLDALAQQHLLREAGQEDLCFGVWFPSRGQDRFSGLLQSLILPFDGERELHGNASFHSRYFERAVGLAAAAGGGLVFMHSHLWPGWQDMSPPDVAAELSIAAAAKGATDLPLIGMTLGTDGSWSARFWERVGKRKYERHWCESVRVAGAQLRLTYHDELIPRPNFREELKRTVSAWGSEAQAHLARFSIGIIGAGSVGNIIGESLARMGVGRLTVIDFDRVERHNLDRLMYAKSEDARRRRFKVDVFARGAKESATAQPFSVDKSTWSIAEEAGFRKALDCDVLFSCVDRPWPRYLLNYIAYAHLIPVVDGGLSIVPLKNSEGIRYADWRAHVAAPTRRCLKCLKQYDPGLVSTERDGYLDDPSYIAGLPTDHELRRNENVFAFSLSTASLEILQFLSMVLAPQGLSDPGAQTYHFVNSTLESTQDPCDSGCPFPGLTARGDTGVTGLTGRHKAAEIARKVRRI